MFPPSSAIAPGGAPSDDFSQDMAILNDDGGGAPDSGGSSTELVPTESHTPELETVEDEIIEDEGSSTPELPPPGEDDDAPGSVPQTRRTVTQFGRPTVKDVTTKYPEFFKDFPSMRRAMFREEEYATIFPTVDDAKEAKSNADSFRHFSDLAMSGKVDDFAQFLGGVAEANGLTPMAANFLPALYQTNRELYFKATSPVVASAIRGAYKAGMAANNENLINAALWMAQQVFGDSKFATGERLPDPIKIVEKSKDINAERQAFYKERYDINRLEIVKTSATKLKMETRKGLDPNGVFNEFTTNLLVDKIIEEVNNRLNADKRHMGHMNSLWKHAFEAGFTGNWKDRILSAYLSAARGLMPGVRTAIRAEALKEKQAQTSRRETEASRSSERRDISGSSNAPGARSTPGRTPSAKEIDWSQTSDMDILSDKITYRKK